MKQLNTNDAYIRKYGEEIKYTQLTEDQSKLLITLISETDTPAWGDQRSFH